MFFFTWDATWILLLNDQNSFLPHQARAPNSPVIIVGTHVDLITKKRYPPTFLSDMQRLIFEKYMCHAEPEKWGLPRVLGRIEVTSRPKLLNSGNINDLVSIVVNVAWEEHLPGERWIPLYAFIRLHEYDLSNCFITLYCQKLLLLILLAPFVSD